MVEKQRVQIVGAEKHKVKITVFRREVYEDLQEQYLANPKSGKCEFFNDGQE